MPSVDFALFPMSRADHGELLGWEVTMLDVTLFQDGSHTREQQRAQSMPLMISEVTELLEGPLLRLVVKHRLKLWLPIAYAYLNDNEWIEALIEQLSEPKEHALGVALIVRWDDLPQNLQRLRHNVDRLRSIGLHAVDAVHAPLALAARPGFAANEPRQGRMASGTRVFEQGAKSDALHAIEFGAAVSVANVVRQLS